MATPLNLNAFRAPAPVVETEHKADWQRFDIATASPDIQSAYSQYREAARIANIARDAFEKSMISKLDLPAHLTLAFGYKFGQLSLALVPAKRPSTGKAALSMSALMARVPA